MPHPTEPGALFPRPRSGGLPHSPDDTPGTPKHQGLPGRRNRQALTWEPANIRTTSAEKAEMTARGSVTVPMSALALTACATAQLHTEAQLNEVAVTCGL